MRFSGCNGRFIAHVPLAMTRFLGVLAINRQVDV
jgi:hypothetical protein